VKNHERDTIAAMFDVLMVFGCEFLRAAQSVTGLALCTPGALSCYRRKALMPVLDEWIHQTFLGKPAHIGEDRALATLVLRSNYKIVHQRTAVARTCVPTTLVGVWKMMLRWTRGDLRENLRMTKFAFKNFPQWNVRSWVLMAYWIALIQNLTLPFLFVPAYFFMIFYGAKDPIVFLAANAFMSLVWAMIPAVIYGHYTRPRKAVWAFLYGSICPFALAFLNIYCFITLRDSRWMTRQVKKKQS
jgi:hyaluronan synthase